MWFTDCKLQTKLDQSVTFICVGLHMQARLLSLLIYIHLGGCVHACDQGRWWTADPPVAPGVPQRNS